MAEPGLHRYYDIHGGLFLVKRDEGRVGFECLPFLRQPPHSTDVPDSIIHLPMVVLDSQRSTAVVVPRVVVVVLLLVLRLRLRT